MEAIEVIEVIEAIEVITVTEVVEVIEIIEIKKIKLNLFLFLLFTKKNFTSVSSSLCFQRNTSKLTGNQNIHDPWKGNQWKTSRLIEWLIDVRVNIEKFIPFFQSLLTNDPRWSQKGDSWEEKETNKKQKGGCSWNVRSLSTEKEAPKKK